MKAAINQAFGDIFNADTGRVGKGAHIQNTFMRHPPAGAFVKHIKRPFEPFGDVVGVQDGHPCGLGQTFAAHHQAIGPADRQKRG